MKKVSLHISCKIQHNNTKIKDIGWKIDIIISVIFWTFIGRNPIFNVRSPKLSILVSLENWDPSIMWKSSKSCMNDQATTKKTKDIATHKCVIINTIIRFANHAVIHALDIIFYGWSYKRILKFLVKAIMRLS